MRSSAGRLARLGGGAPAPRSPAARRSEPRSRARSSPAGSAARPSRLPRAEPASPRRAAPTRRSRRRPAPSPPLAAPPRPRPAPPQPAPAPSGRRRSRTRRSPSSCRRCRPRLRRGTAAASPATPPASADRPRPRRRTSPAPGRLPPGAPALHESRPRRNAISLASLRPLAFLQRGPSPRLSYGEVAQLVEHTTENRGVAGSIPALAIAFQSQMRRPPRRRICAQVNARSTRGVEPRPCDQCGACGALERLRQYGLMASQVDHSLVRIIERASIRAGELSRSGSVPTKSVPTLIRTDNGLEPATEDEIDWQSFFAEIERAPGFWDAMVEVVEAARSDEDIEITIGWDSDLGVRAQTLWRDILEPITLAYGAEQPDWAWDETLALSLISSWREGHRATSYAKQTIAPLHNCRGMGDGTEIEPGLAIRRLTDADRAALWRIYGAERFSGPLNPRIADLERWSFAIDCRWELPQQPPLSNEYGAEVVRDTVRALRLHHPGVTGTTIIWTRPDPEHPWRHDTLGSGLYAPLGTSPGQFMDRLEAQVGPHCGTALRDLMRGLRNAAGDQQLDLALSRFDAAYTRHDPGDRLIDLWVAFEALLLPDGQHELSYRSAIRIAQLVGSSGAERQEAFDLAHLSYKQRSKLVHGDLEASKLGGIVEKTRELARKALRAWILNPPPDGVKTLDHAIFE